MRILMSMLIAVFLMGGQAVANPYFTPEGAKGLYSAGGDTLLLDRTS
jgi:hypothetical protein